MEELKENRNGSLRRLFPEYKWNYMAEAILEGAMGKVLVNDKENPSVAVLSLPQYKLHILGGDARHPAAREFLAALPGFSTLFFGMPGWSNLLDQIHKGKVIVLKRYAFSSESLDIEQLKRLKSQLSENFHIERINFQIAQRIANDKSDLTDGQLFGFASPQEFIERGFGYCALENEKIVCIASTGTVCSKGIEVQINTHKKYRGRGLASATGAALLIECLENGIDPNWDAATEISAGLAKKLGYAPKGEYDSYVYTGSRFLVNLRKFLRRIRGKEV
ncbi:MAG: GNAT family N-acetyltransferase [Flavobacteriales bacterium]|nr:GNAT family N-acetyltransferase [Flavobacteriales bacterium]